MVLEKTPESPLNSKEIKPVNPKGNQLGILGGRSILRPPDAKCWKRPWCWERFMASEGEGRGRDGWIASPTQWTWIWASSGRWWRTGQSSAAVQGHRESNTTEWLTMTTTQSSAVAAPGDGHGGHQLHQAQGQSTRVAKDVTAWLTGPARTPWDESVDPPGPQAHSSPIPHCHYYPHFTNPPTAAAVSTLVGPGAFPSQALRVPFHSNSRHPGKRTTRNHCGIKPDWFKRRYRLPWLALLGWRASSSLLFLFPRGSAFPAQSYIFWSVCACCSVEGRGKRHSRGQVIVARNGLENPRQRDRTQGRARASHSLYKQDNFLKETAFCCV